MPILFWPTVGWYLCFQLTFLRRLLSRKVAAFLRSTVTVFFLQALQAQSRHRRGPWFEAVSAVSRAAWGCGTCSCSCSFDSLLLSLDSFGSVGPFDSLPSVLSSTEPDSPRSAEASADTTDDASSESTAYLDARDLSTHRELLPFHLCFSFPLFPLFLLARKRTSLQKNSLLRKRTVASRRSTWIARPSFHEECRFPIGIVPGGWQHKIHGSVVRCDDGFKMVKRGWTGHEIRSENGWTCE